MGFIDVNGVSLTLPDGRPLLDEVSFRVGEGTVSALIGPNGAGKSTLLRIIRGETAAESGAISLGGTLGVMEQFIGHIRDSSTVQDLLISVAPARIRRTALALKRAELAIQARDELDSQLKFATAISEYAEAGGYEFETVWDQCTMAALGSPFEAVRAREVRSLSGGEQKRLALEALFRGTDEVLVLDEPDNYLDVPAKRWLEETLKSTRKTVLLVSHDRELLARAADRIISLELGPAGATAWTHGGSFSTYHEAREARMERLDELRRRWDEQHSKLRALVQAMKTKATASDEFASRYQAALTRLRKFEEAGPPLERPVEQKIQIRLGGDRTGKKVLVCEKLELVGLMSPFDLEVWFGDRVAILGSNGSGKSHFLRLLAQGGSDPDPRSGHLTSVGASLAPVEHRGVAKLGARVVPGWFAQMHEHPQLLGRTLLEILHRGDEDRDGMPREAASRILDRYGLAGAAEQDFGTLSGGQQARFQILLLEATGVTLLLLDEPTDNLDLVSAEALQSALERFEGTVMAVTHDRWFARSCSRFLVFGSDGRVYESAEPVWDESRVVRSR